MIGITSEILMEMNSNGLSFRIGANGCYAIDGVLLPHHEMYDAKEHPKLLPGEACFITITPHVHHARSAANPRTAMAPTTASRPYPGPIQFCLDVACGRHALSKLVPPLLWLLDGVLTSLIIWKVPCQS